ncbi:MULTISPECIES: SGNH/GDSL hydrolase family protein [Sphingomonas]|uniref:SGNH/GDSL hydrolase family protein n=1 Tax=Sphingomonas TaxID=13687 RepID=UPI000F7DA356|nr:SGNH/GDSL hydrolase family protein [Sphingomonas sp. ABOLF]RSV13198.1 GDSL family lipase [Sphingomonas sp. ABOLF]GLK22527.1 acylneuraminate cytidylyltransferase [Microbacterium terregens]
MNHAVRLFLVPLLLAAPASAQVKLPGDPHASDPVGIVADPCPSRAEETDPEGREMRKLHQVTRDWAQLCRYHRDNAAVRGQPVSVVFMGDSITDGWIKGDPDFFKEGRIDRGIGGQTTPQMLVRFREDVIALKPKAVHIMAGTNDIAGNTGAATMAMVQGNIQGMAELARANGIKVILASIPPAAAFPWSPDKRPAPQIAEMNAWLKRYAAAEGFTYVDYHPALATAEGAMKPGFANDGVHPTPAGYAAMRPVALEAIRRTLGK